MDGCLAANLVFVLRECHPRALLRVLFVPVRLCRDACVCTQRPSQHPADKLRCAMQEGSLIVPNNYNRGHGGSTRQACSSFLCVLNFVLARERPLCRLDFDLFVGVSQAKFESIESAYSIIEEYLERTWTRAQGTDEGVSCLVIVETVA